MFMGIRLGSAKGDHLLIKDGARAEARGKRASVTTQSAVARDEYDEGRRSSSTCDRMMKGRERKSGS